MINQYLALILKPSRLSLAISLALLGASTAYAGEDEASVSSRDIDVMSVTATREERASKEVPAAISVIDGERLESARMFNITDALSDTPGVLINSKNGGYDARLIIRGAGLKANYGIREIMMLRDGVPITDPDSFTRLDFIDTQDIERVEVTKGPGNIYAVGSAGGTIQLISKSVFDTTGTKVKLGLGTEGTNNLHVRSGHTFGDDEEQAIAVTFSHRATDNDWRAWNEFQSDQFSVKHGIFFDDETTLETELSYTRSDLNLPGSLNEAQYELYKDTGEVSDNNSAFKHSARDSRIWFFNSRLEKNMGALTYKPRLYANYWSHFHPVTGRINDTNGVTIIGTDQEFTYDHNLWGASQLVAGLTLKQDKNNDSKKYRYADVATIPSGRITSTLSNDKGSLMETETGKNTVLGMFFQESMRPTDRWLIDAGFRVDTIKIDNTVNEIEAYSFSQGQYVTGAGILNLDKEFNLFSANVGASYKLSDTTNVFANIAQGDQVPFGSELESNPDLKAATVRNIEVGLKGRALSWQYDTSVYFITADDEVISGLEDGQTIFQNAGKTEKKGLEFAGSKQVINSAATGDMWLGLNYAYSHYRYDQLAEIIRVAGVPTAFDRSGNQLAYVPEQQYSVFASWEHASGWKARLQSDTWGEYFLDSANSEKFEGYQFITSLNVAYDTGAHSVSANIQNLTDKRYAVEVKKDSRGDKSYTPGAPRSLMLSYQYQF